MSKTYSFTQRAIDGFVASCGDFTDVEGFLLKMHAENLLRMGNTNYFEPRVSAGKDIDWHILDEKTDIVLDDQLHQIYPQKTGKYPAFIRDLLQKTK